MANSKKDKKVDELVQRSKKTLDVKTNLKGGAAKKCKAYTP